MGLCVCPVLFSIFTKETRVVPEKELSYARTVYPFISHGWIVHGGERQERAKRSLRHTKESSGFVL